MKKVVLLIMSMLLTLSLAACGNKKTDDMSVTTEESKEETKVEAPKGMTREEVIEKYFSPMEELKMEYENQTDPDELERIAQEYNKLAVEGRLAYIEATGSAPNSEFIPRQEYLMKSAYYRVIEAQVSGYGTLYDYNKIRYNCTPEFYVDENENPYPTNIFEYADEEQEELLSVNPEAGDMIFCLINEEQIDHANIVIDFMIIRDGGKKTQKVTVSDYTDKTVADIYVFGEYVIFDKGMSQDDYIIFKDTGDSLEFVEEYFEYDDAPSYMINQYGTSEIITHNREVKDMVFDAAEEFHIRIDE